MITPNLEGWVRSFGKNISLSKPEGTLIQAGLGPRAQGGFRGERQPITLLSQPRPLERT